jgi:WD40 repeat protein
VVFSPDGEQLLTGRKDGKVWMWSCESGDPIRDLEGHADWVSTITFSSDGSQLLTASYDGTARLWDVNSGEEIQAFKGHESAVTAADFLPDGQHMLTSSHDGTIRLWNVSTSEEKARMISLRDGSWLVLTPEGRFDAPDLERIRGAVWIAPDDPLTPLPIEAFMRDYYEPNLLPRILSGEMFPEIKGLLERNRVQPIIEISDVTVAPDGTASVTIDATSVKRAYGGKTRTSEVHDLRLFRNGQLVAWTDSLVTSGTVTTTLRYDDIALPTTGVDSITFSAYAFNDDRVKSRTAYRSIALNSRRERPRRAYIISLGVDQFTDPAWNLRFAANDAWQYQSVLTDGLRGSEAFDEVIPVPLVSSGAQAASTDAKKATLKAVFDLLAGREAEPMARARIPNAARLQEATPDDLVLITASTHGYTDPAGTFYLLPSDIPLETGRQVTQELLNASISSDELTAWLRSVDAGDFVMVVDACHAAAAVEGTDFKPGPMGSRGLGQLAFNKGMRILTATQSADVALEVNELQQGLLSYALVADGLRQSAADREPVDSRVTLSEWIAYGVDRVPELHRRLHAGEPITDAGGEIQVDVRGIDVPQTDERFQRPSLFDFRRQDRAIVLKSGVDR